MRQGEPAEDDSPRRQAGWHAAEAVGQVGWLCCLALYTMHVVSCRPGLSTMLRHLWHHTNTTCLLFFQPYDA